MTLNLANMQRQAPAQEHASLAAARVPFVQANDAAALQNAAQQLGFQTVAPNQYVHPTDGSWVALNGGRLERGVGNVAFQGRPVDVGALPIAAIGAFGAVAAQKVPPQGGGPALAGQLTQLGFTQVLPSYFVHPDASWVAVTPDLGVVRGHGQQRLHTNDVPAATSPTATQTTPTPTTPATPAAKTADSVLAYPKTTAPSFDDGFYACSLPGRLAHSNLAADRAQLLQWGFAESAPGLFEHPDGSWVAYTSSGSIERGAHQQMFQRVPVGPHRMSPAAPSFQHLAMACADPSLANLTAQQVLDGDKVLAAAGYSEVRKGLWRHADSSFVAATGGALHFGAGQQLFNARPSLQTLTSIPADLNAVRQTAAIWDMPADPAAARTFLQQNGFQETRTDFFMQGNIWVAIDTSSGAPQLVAGMNQNRFSAVPTPSLLPQIASNASHAWLAVARTANVAHDDPNLAATLGNLGFTAQGNGLYVANDGSWLVATAKSIVRGVQGNVFSDVPQPPAPGTYQQYTQKPGGSWYDWAAVNGFAIARIPVFQGQFTAAQAAQCLTHLGFTEVNPGQWHHPDGSQLTLSNPTTNPYFAGCMFQQWDFGQFPYNRSTGSATDGQRSWQHMTQETAQWLQWASGQGTAAPWPAFK